MPTCHRCDEAVAEGLPYRCNECGELFCQDHRLPEAHDCDALKAGVSTQVSEDEDEGWETPEPMQNLSPWSNQSFDGDQRSADEQASTDGGESGAASDAVSAIWPSSEQVARTRGTLYVWWVRVRSWARTAIRGAALVVFLISAWATIFRRIYPPPYVGGSYEATGIPSPFRIVPGLDQPPFVEFQLLTWLFITLATLVASWRLTR